VSRACYLSLERIRLILSLLTYLVGLSGRSVSFRSTPAPQSGVRARGKRSISYLLDRSCYMFRYLSRFDDNGRLGFYIYPRCSILTTQQCEMKQDEQPERSHIYAIDPIPCHSSPASLPSAEGEQKPGQEASPSYACDRKDVKQ
jgi:hypothetical protein